MKKNVLFAVSDANVLIDVDAGELAESMFSIPHINFYLPDVLFHQELRTRHAHFLKLGLQLKILPGHLVAKTAELMQNYPKPSRMDIFALVLAMENDWILLTGDKNLKKVAEHLKLECHGTIWVVDQMLKSDVITSDTARDGFQKMKKNGSRLPWDEAEKMIKNHSHSYI